MAAGYVAVLVIGLHFPQAGSLKAKRSELQSAKALLHGRMGAAVAETGYQDSWQRAELTAALTSGSLRHLEDAASRLEEWLHGHFPQGVTVERIVASVDDLRR